MLRAKSLFALLGISLALQSAAGQAAAADTLPNSSSAQGRATLRGRVTGESGTPVVGATVVVPSLERQTLTDKSGEFVLRDLPASTVWVQVRAIGFQAYLRQLSLSPNAETRLDTSLPAATVQLTSLVITATSSSADPATPLDVTALPPEQLKAAGGASLGATLGQLRGVSNISTGPMAGNPVLRGMSQGQIRLTRDGLALESYQGTSRWTPPISLGSVERVEVIRGPASVFYGSSALGGAINFLPKPLPRADGGRVLLDALVEQQLSSNNGERYLNGEFASALRGIGLRAGLNRRVAGDFATGAAQSFTETGIRHDPLFVGKLPYSNYDQTASYGQLGTSGAWGQAQILYDGFSGYNNFLNSNGRPTGVRNQNYELRLRGSLLGRRWIVKPAFAMQDLRIQRAATVAETFETARERGSWDQDLEKLVYTGRAEAEHAPLGRLSGKLGAEYQYQDGTTRLSAIEPSSDVMNTAVFVFEEWRESRVTLSAGARYDYRNQRAAMGSLVASLPDSQRASALRRTFSTPNGSLGVGIRLTPALTWTSSISTGFRAPAIQDLYTNENRPAFGWLEGNPFLRPERSRSLESSLRLQSARASATATAYRNHVADYIYMTNTGRTRVVGSTARSVFGNAQTGAVLEGIELDADAEVLPRLFASSSFAAMRTENVATGESLPLMPPENLRLSLRYSPPRIGALRAPTIRFGGRHVWGKRIAGPTEPFADADANPKGFGIASTPPYSLFDGAISGRMIIAGSPVDLSLQVENLFDRAYRDFLDTQKGFALSMGRNASFRIAVPITIMRH